MTNKPLWNVKSGTNIAQIAAGTPVNIQLPVSNPPVEYTASYPPNDAPVEIYDFSNYFNIDLRTPHNPRFVGNASAFADVNYSYIKSNGLPVNRSHVRFVYSTYTAKPNAYVFRIPRQRNIIDPSKKIKTTGIIGVAIDGVPIRAPFSNKTHVFNNTVYTDNDVLNPFNYPTGNGTNLVEADGLIYYISDPKLLYHKDPTAHSPIIGYALDGWPIYGPYGYANVDGTGDVILMTSSYKIKTQARANGTIPDGSFIEDYVYINGSGILDEYNGRECITPEYPKGVYAYFVTVNPYNTDEPIYPYIIGPIYKGKPLLPNGNVSYPGDLSLSVISNILPPGLRIAGNTIVGTAYAINVDTDYSFVIRATNSDGISDITLTISVAAEKGLIWETPAGSIPVGNNDLFPIPMQFDPNFTGPDLKLIINDLLVIAQPEMVMHLNEPTVLSTYGIQIGYKVMFSMVADRVVFSKTAIGLASHQMDLTTYLGNTIDSIGYYDNGSVIGNDNQFYINPFGFVYAIEIYEGLVGLGYTDGYNIEVTGGSGTGLKINFKVDHEGRIVQSSFLIPDGGFGYTDADILSIPGGDNSARIRITSIEEGKSNFTDSSIIDVAVDRQNHLIWLRVDGGNWNNSPTDDPVIASGGIDISFLKDTVYPAVSPYNNGSIIGQFLIKQIPHYPIPYGFAFVGDEIKGDVYYALDNAPISYQLSVVDQNISLSASLNFYIPPNGGDLPLGITLSPSGLLSGFTQPILTKITSDTNGNYDMNFYDKAVYDYGIPPNNGFDSFIYDLENYDYSYLVNIPKKLNRYYQFIVRATDGYFYEDRKFKIFIVGDDHVRADTTLIPAGTNFYRTDVTYLRKPIWLTPNYLGFKRANNYVTIQTTIYVSDTLTGIVYYLLDKTNEDGSPSKLPTGLQLDEQTGVIFGAIPYQNAVTKTYKFTIRAFRYDATKDISVDTPRTFTLDIIGNIESAISFTTTGDLGSIYAGIQSTLKVTANTKIKNGILVYELYSGTLPPGLLLFNDGSIQGKVNQFANSNLNGLTTIDKATTSFDGGTTRIDRQFIFTVKASDQLNLASVTKTFSIEVATLDNLPYSNIYVKPFLDESIRINVLSFLNDINVFTPDLLYRPTDPEFGVQKNLKMLLYPGIETLEAYKYISAFGRIYKKQFRLGDVKKAVANFPGTNTAVYEVVYVEVIDNQENSNGSMKSVVDINHRRYPISVNQGRNDIIDDSLDNNIGISENADVYKRFRRSERAMSADYNGQRAGDSNKSTIFGNSVTNIRNNISQLGNTERNYLPLWMRTPQTFSGVISSFTKAIVLCYCQPGAADKIILNIKYSGFDFKTVNYTVDRAIIDNVTNSQGDKYLLFPAQDIIGS
jgi:YHYH protein/Putative Ig domain